MVGVAWDYFDRFKMATGMYLPDRGEGTTKASQIVTAVTKLVYKWYNDGDVFDNTHYLSGWANDLSSYANWLAKYVPQAEVILDRIYSITSEGEYEEILKELADKCLDMEDLEKAQKEPAIGSIYDCDGAYVFEEMDDEEEEW